MPLRQQSLLEEKQIQPYLYTKDKLPCLVRHGAELEDLPQADSEPDEYYQVNARNALRKLTYGTSLFKGSFFKWSNLKLAWLNFKALTLKRDKKLLAALRVEMKIIFQKAYQISKHCDPSTEERLEIFINTLLSNFPFMDPEEGEEILLPQKIGNEWRQVPYKFNKLDLSPKTGFWSKIIEEEDRIYAYGLEPQLRVANPYLLLMGTTYFSGQGAGLSLLGDLTYGQSVGERHDHRDLEKWILRHRNIKVSGHSQGGTMAMLVAAKYPEYTLVADSLNPTALHQASLRSLLPTWQAHRGRRPLLRVLTQAGDPVFIFGDGFLPGTRIFRVNHPKSAKDSRLSAHAHHYSGHESATYTELSAEHLELDSNKRKFFNDLKAVADLTVGPLLALNLIYSIAKRKIKRFCSKHAGILRAILFLAALTTCAVLLSTAVFAPIGLALASSLTPVLTQGILAVGVIAASTVTTYLAPKLLNFAVNLTQAAVGLALACVLGLTLALSGVVAALGALKRACFGSKQPDLNPPALEPIIEPRSCNASTRLSLISLGGGVRVEAVLKSKLKKSHSESDLPKLSFTAAGQPREQEVPESKQAGTVARYNSRSSSF